MFGGENFPYTNFHDLNTDWLIKIAKDFLDQYTHLQETIDTGLTDLTDKATELEALLQAWYDTHSNDIAQQLANSLTALQAAFNTSLANVSLELEAEGQRIISTIPSDYSSLNTNVEELTELINSGCIYLSPFVQGARSAYNGTLDSRTDRCSAVKPIVGHTGDFIYFSNIPDGIKVAMAGCANNENVYDSGWQTSDFGYTVTAAKDGALFIINAAKIDGSSAITPSECANISVIHKNRNRKGHGTLPTPYRFYLWNFYEV